MLREWVPGCKDVDLGICPIDFRLSPPSRKVKGVIQKAVTIKDDIMLANASHSLCAYSNLWGRYHVFIEKFMMLIITMMSCHVKTLDRNK